MAGGNRPKKVGKLSGAFLGDLTVLGEILEINQNGIVFLVGFQKNSFPDFDRSDRAKKITEKAIVDFHTLFNIGNKDEIWNEANPKFREIVEKEMFNQHLDNVKAGLGNFKSVTKNIQMRTIAKGDVTTVDIKQRSMFEKMEIDEGFTFAIQGDKASLIGWRPFPPEKEEQKAK